MPVAKGYLQLLEGVLDLKSSPGKGSEFSVKLRRKLSEEEIEEKEKNRKVTKAASVLVAEDNDSNYELIFNYLRNYGMTLVRAENGRDAIDKFSASGVSFRYVLMDLHMPVMNGLEATKKIRAMDPQTVIIAQSAYTGEKEEALKCGCNEFISKPFTKSQLLDALGLE